jgi:hypothetical protein
MLKKKTFLTIALVLGVMLAFSLMGCDTSTTGGGDSGGSGGGGGGDGTTGVVTITNLPAIQTTLSVGVFDYQGAFTTKAEYNSVISSPGSGSIAATRFADIPIMTQPVTIYNREGFSFTSVFSSTGQYLVVIETGNSATLDEPRYYGQIVFTNGNATINYNNPTFHAGMLGGE